MPLEVKFVAKRTGKKFAHAPKVRVELEAVLVNVIRPKLIAEFASYTANWQHNPQWVGRKTITANSAKDWVHPIGKNEQIYAYVTLGTKPHKIAAKNAKTLAFMWGGTGSYQAKTKPGGGKNGPGTVSGGKMRYPIEVNHPGTEARDIEKSVKKSFEPMLKTIMAAAWQRIIRTL